jgi:rod shape determining protein RodA
MTRKINIWANLDWLSVIIFLFLIITGWISVYSAVYDEAHQSIFDTSQRYGKQLIWMITALFIAAAVMMTDTKLFLFFSYFFYGLTILMLIGILIFGVEINGQKAWFQFGGFQIQPSEFAKMATALALAQYISSTKLKMHDPVNLLRIGTIIFAPVMLIMLQPDPGSAIVFFAFILVLYREGLTGYVLSISILFMILSVLTLLLGETEMLGVLLVIALVTYPVIDRNIKGTIRGALIFLGS